MKRPHKVEFYISAHAWNSQFGTAHEPIEYGWRLCAPNSKVIDTPHEGFISHRNAVESFRRVANAMGCAEGTVFEVDGFDKEKSVRLLCR